MQATRNELLPLQCDRYPETYTRQRMNPVLSAAQMLGAAAPCFSHSRNTAARHVPTGHGTWPLKEHRSQIKVLATRRKNCSIEKFGKTRHDKSFLNFLNSRKTDTSSADALPDHATLLPIPEPLKRGSNLPINSCAS